MQIQQFQTFNETKLTRRDPCFIIYFFTFCACIFTRHAKHNISLNARCSAWHVMQLVKRELRYKFIFSRSLTKRESLSCIYVYWTRISVDLCTNCRNLVYIITITPICISEKIFNKIEILAAHAFMFYLSFTYWPKTTVQWMNERHAYA